MHSKAETFQIMAQPMTLRQAIAYAFLAVSLPSGASLAAQDSAAFSEGQAFLVAQAQTSAQKQDKSKKGAAKEAKTEDKSSKPVQVGNYGDWGAFVAQSGKDKTCYALSTPKDRAPSSLKRDPAYIFIATRPAENVRNEVSIIMGFPIKEAGTSKAEISSASFDLVAKGSNAWIKNPAEEPRFIEAAKKGAQLIVQAPSVRGNVTTDTYSLSGVTQALERVQKECQ
jgi:hypothetical protein